MYLFLLLSLCVTLCCGHYDNEDWTDPTDMFNYDAATGKMIKLKHNTEEKVEAVCEKDGEDTCPGKKNGLVVNTEQSRQVTEEHKNKDDLKSPQSNSNPVIRRYLRKLLNEAERFGLPEDSSSEVYYNAEMFLTKQMVIEIQKFIDDEDWNVGALEDALIRTLVQFRFHNVKEWWASMFEDYLGIDLGTTLKILLCITCIVSILATELWSRIGWFTQIKRLCILSFIVSVAWNWMYLYKVAFAERQAELTKMHKFDGSCGEKISWSESLIEWWKGASTFQNDPCEEYFKALMINPALMVPPTKALALTFTDFITEPLKHVGKAIGEFLNGLLSEIPVFYQLLVLILIAVIIIASCYGASKSVGHVLVHRNNRDEHRERLPPAEPQRPPHGNVIEGWRQQPYYIEPQFVPVYRYPRSQRPESLQATDVTDRNNMRLPGVTDVGLTVQDKDGEELKREQFTDQRRGKTGEPTELSSPGKHQRRELLKETSNGPQQRENEPLLESSLGQLQSKEDLPEQKSFTKYETKQDALLATTNGTHQSKAEQTEVETVHQNTYGDHQRTGEPLERSSGQLEGLKDSVEEVSHRDQAWREGHLHDKSLELKGDLKKDPLEQKIIGEAASRGCEAPVSS